MKVIAEYEELLSPVDEKRKEIYEPREWRIRHHDVRLVEEAQTFRAVETFKSVDVVATEVTPLRFYTLRYVKVSAFPFWKAWHAALLSSQATHHRCQRLAVKMPYSLIRKSQTR